MEAAVLRTKVVPDGDLVLVMTSDEAWHRRHSTEKHPLPSLVHRTPSRKDVSAGDETASVDDQSGDIRIRVDSARLMRISKPFQVFLNPNTREGRQLIESGQTELQLDEDDPAAMCHLMNCIFGNNREVPSLPGRISDQQVDFETFFEACVIVDKYDLHEAACLLVEYWWSVFEPRPISVGGGSFFRRISIAHILGKHNELARMIRTYTQRGSGLDGLEAMPVPQALYDAETRRVHAFGSLNAFIDRLSRVASGTELPICSCGDIEIARSCDRALFDLDQAGKLASVFHIVNLGGLVQSNTWQSIVRCVTRGTSYLYRAHVRPRSWSGTNRDNRPLRFLHNKCSFEMLKRALSKVQPRHPCKEEREQQSIRTEQELAPTERWSAAALPPISSIQTSLHFNDANPAVPCWNQTRAFYEAWLASANDPLPITVGEVGPGLLGYELVGSDGDGSLEWFMDPRRMDLYYGPDSVQALSHPQGHSIPVSRGHNNELIISSGYPNPTLSPLLEPCPGPKEAFRKALQEMENILYSKSPLEIIKID